MLMTLHLKCILNLYMPAAEKSLKLIHTNKCLNGRSEILPVICLLSNTNTIIPTLIQGPWSIEFMFSLLRKSYLIFLILLDLLDFLLITESWSISNFSGSSGAGLWFQWQFLIEKIWIILKPQQGEHLKAIDFLRAVEEHYLFFTIFIEQVLSDCCHGRDEWGSLVWGVQVISDGTKGTQHFGNTSPG